MVFAGWYNRMDYVYDEYQIVVSIKSRKLIKASVCGTTHSYHSNRHNVVIQKKQDILYYHYRFVLISIAIHAIGIIHIDKLEPSLCPIVQLWSISSSVET